MDWWIYIQGLSQWLGTTVDENIFVDPKMPNDVWYTANLYIFPVLYIASFCIALFIFFALKGDSESKGKHITIAFSEKEQELLL